jgi:GAF domain-containing protein
MPANTSDVAATLVELADTLVSDYDLLDYLDVLLGRSTSILGAVAGGVMLTDGESVDTRLNLLACTDEHTRVLELFELQRQEGPCWDSHRLGQPVVEEDLTRSERWPQFRPVALKSGYRAVYAFPLRLRGATIGALNLFRVQPGAVDDDEVRAAQAFADMATIGILQQRAVQHARDLAGQLQTALNSRVVIEQAKGIIAERLDCDVDEAFQTLRQFSRNNNLQLRSTAAALVAGELTPDVLARPQIKPIH